MALRQFRALVFNDFRLHGLGIAAAQAGVLLLLFLMGRLKPDAGAGAAAGLVFNLNFLMVIVWGDWLIAREKTKGTLGWLRTLPISDDTVLASKYASYFLCCLSMWVLSSVLFASRYFASGNWIIWAILLGCLIAEASLSLAARLYFGQKLGQVVPLLAVGLPLVVFLALRRMNGGLPARLIQLWSTPGGHAAVLAGLIAMCAIVIGGTAAWMARAETHSLIE